MILANRGQFIEAKFVFVTEGQVYDPTIKATPSDIYFSILRGDTGNGPILDGPYSFLRGNVELADKVQVIRTGNGQFTFRYKVPQTLMPGTYSIVARTSDGIEQFAISALFQVRGDPVTLSPIVISNNSSTVVNYTPSYDDLNRSSTNTILLIGHSDNLELNVPVRLRSMQSAIDILGADLRSPLLRGVYDAYAAGARDIFVLAAAPLSEYADRYQDRTVSSVVFDLDSATPTSRTFYQQYYMRLTDTYEAIKELDFIDFIVPLETSIIKTGGVDFVTQLAVYLADFHNNTSFVQLGIIGSRSGGISSSDLDEIKNNPVLVNKLTQYRSDNTVSSDIGRFVIPIYGEAVYQHSELKTSYTSTLAASYAGMFATMPLNMGLIRTRIPGAMALHGSDLTQSEMNQLDNLGINTIYRGRRTRRSVTFEVYGTNEYTLAKKDSTLSKAAQMRLIAALISQVKDYAYDAVGRFGYDKSIDKVRGLLLQMKASNIIVDFSFNVEVDPLEKSKLIFYIQLLSSLGLKKIDFSIAAGPEA